MTTEILTTVALRPGMRVQDRAVPKAPTRIVAAVSHPAAGCWDVTFADTTEHAVVGARHPWAQVDQ